MGSLGNTTTSYQLDDDVCTVLVPGWPNQPRVEARDDGLDEVTITVAKAHSHEAWRLVRLRRGVLCAIVHLTGGRPLEGQRLQRTDYNMVVQVPPARLPNIRVLTHTPDNTDNQ